jgi:sulfonate dioxygenase
VLFDWVKKALTESSDIRVHGHFGGEYHGDHSFEVNPPSYTLLRLISTPPTGGDTIFTSQTGLFDKLSPTFQKTFEGLHAIHSSDVSFEINEEN